MSFLSNLTWKKTFSVLGSCASLGVGVYIYLLIPSAESNNVEEVLTRAGFESIEKASAEDLMKIVAAYKEALKNEEKFEKMEDVEVEGKTDEEIGKQIQGGGRSLVKGSATSVNKNTGRRWCVVPVTIEETLSKQGIRFLDVDGTKDNNHWGKKVELLIQSGKADEEIKQEQSLE